MEKYRLVREELLRREILSEENLIKAPLASKEDILRVHCEEYYDHIEKGTLDSKAQKLIGFPWSEVMIKRSRASVGGFLSAVESALLNGVGGNLSGGTHHSFRDRGEGFCVFNDFAVAGFKLIEEKNFHDILVLDLDVHQGNGNASLMTSKEETFVVSLHGERNYPYRRPPSDIDIDLPDHTQDSAYLEVLEQTLEKLSRRKWDIILYQAGVDTLKEDKLGRLDLTLDGLIERDRLVLSFAKNKQIPIALGLGGGYSSPISTTIEGHLNTYKVVREIFS